MTWINRAIASCFVVMMDWGSGVSVLEVLSLVTLVEMR